MLKKVRLTTEIAKQQLSLSEIKNLQKSKRNVIDPDTSEPSDLNSIKSEPDDDLKVNFDKDEE